MSPSLVDVFSPVWVQEGTKTESAGGDLVDKVGEMKIKDESPKQETLEMRQISSSPELVLKHPLQNSWTLWYFKNDRSQRWEDNQRQVLTVGTVEDFWALYHHVEVASLLPAGSDYSLFKEGILPDWEDRRNALGGRWIVAVDRRKRAECLDTYWLEILYLLVGETTGPLYADQVNGAVVNVRGKGDKLAVWLADAGEEESVLYIGRMIKKKLMIEQDQTIQFSVHNEEKARMAGIKKICI